jgi:hypothetical protein
MAALQKKGFSNQQEAWQMTLRVYKVDMELCETTKERIAILEKILTVYKQMEERTAQKVAAALVNDTAVLEARVNRLDAEITLEREKAQLASH